MFKEDGTEVRNPKAFVAAFQWRGGEYKGGLFDQNKVEIQDPVAFVAQLEATGKLQAQPSSGKPPLLAGLVPGPKLSADGSSSGVFKADGTPVRDPVAFVAGFEKRGGTYSGGLFDSDGKEIKDPVAYVKGMNKTAKELPKDTAPPATVSGSQTASSSSWMFKADGTPVRDPVAFVKGIEKRGGSYDGGLYDSKGKEIKDPVAYVGGTTKSNGNVASAEMSSGKIFKADGTAVRDPIAYVNSMEWSGGYKGGLFNEKGEEIRDPVAYFAKMGGASSSRSSSRSSMPTYQGSVYKEDGTPVRDPVAFVAAFEKHGGSYTGGLFNGKGEEIRDPVAYVSKLGGGKAGNREASYAAMPVDSSSLFKADGTLVRNPAAYIEAMGKSGGYQGGLFNAKGEEIRNPEAYVKNAKAPSSVSAAAPVDSLSLFKADGTLVRKPMAYIEAMEKSGGYQGGLYNAKGEEIRNVEAYLKKNSEVGSKRPAQSEPLGREAKQPRHGSSWDESSRTT